MFLSDDLKYYKSVNAILSIADANWDTLDTEQ